ncbi:MAG: SxtJ family membrane protein [Candidatus Omnitrophica bacterium]|nr:SxtJ family membrane protein [Candidatus Omnitrophota bacterium]
MRLKSMELKTTKEVTAKEIRKFGITLAAIFFLTSWLNFFNGRFANFIFLVVYSSAFFIISLLHVQWLKLLYLIFIKVSQTMGWLNTRLFLSIIYYLVIVPFGLIMKALGNNPLGQIIAKKEGSYWRRKEPPQENITSYEKAF